MTGRTTKRGRLATASLRRRVTVTTVAVFVVVLAGVIVAVNASFTVITNRSVTAVLNDHVQLAQQLAAQNIPPAQLAQRLENRSVRVRLVLADGQEFGTLKTPAAETDPSLRVRRILLANTSGPLVGARLTLALDGRLLAGARVRLLRVLLVIAVVAAAMILVGVPLASRYALAPLDAMTRLARQVAAGRRGQRLSAHPASTELGRTAAAFDEMLDALEGAEQRALRSEESMRRFVADAAHELRTPIAGITAAAEAVVAQPDDGDPETRRELLLLLGRETRRAGRLVDDLLDLANIDAGLSLHPQPTNLRKLAHEQVDRAALLAPQLTLRVDGPDVVASVDAGRISQVLANLLNNAVQVTPAGATIRVAVSATASHAQVAAVDGGPGVPDSDRETIFDRLVRLDGARANGGSGLGLAIARGIARAHGGDVVCRPGDPGGSAFVLTVPVDGFGRPNKAMPP